MRMALQSSILALAVFISCALTSCGGGDSSGGDDTSPVPQGVYRYVEQFRVISQVQADVDLTPETDALTTTYAGLNDGIDNTSQTLTVPPGTRDLNIGIKVDGQEVDVLYLYTTIDMTTVAGFSSFDYSWSLYQSSDLFGTTWQVIATNLGLMPSQYQSNTQTANHSAFRIDVSNFVQGSPNYIKLVLNSSYVAQTLEFHEIEAYKGIIEVY